jgi:ATP-binding cassette subfamily C (CFTR/MRP) protein 1
LVEASVSVSRLNEFLQAPELQADAVRREPPVQYIDDETVSVKRGTFKWSTSRTAPPILSDIQFSARKGELSCIVGRVGAGKSSFLSALLGDMVKLQGEVVTRGKVAYVAQTPWIMNASVKENILFGHRLDPDFYERTVEACAMSDDFKALPDGDNTEVGEKGISLSGGQKARLALARAVYARADIYLLDDPLSAVDAHVGRHLIDNVLGPQGLLKTKARVLATNAITVLPQADAIIMIRAGKIVETGSYDTVMATKRDLYNLIVEFGKRADEEGPKTDDETDASELTLVPQNDSAVASDEDTGDLIESQLIKVPRRGTMRRASMASFHRGKKKDIEGRTRLTEQKEEHMEQGRVQWDVYVQYAKACSYIGIFAHVLLVVGSQTAQVGKLPNPLILVARSNRLGGNLWLKKWSESNELDGDNSNFTRFITVYFLLGLSMAVLVALSAIVLYLVCCLRGSKKLHDDMATAVLRSPMQFFETTPVGRILNRFSNDVYKIDEVIPRTFSMFFRNSCQVVFVMVVISTTTPAFIALIIPFAGIYYYIQRYYLSTSRELKRLESIARSPVYSHFQESLGGISTIRAYEQTDRFMRENEWRIDINSRAYFPLISANRWLAVRLEFIGSLIIFSAASLSIISLFTTGISAGRVGLAMSYALQTTQSLNWIVRQTVEVETNIVSVERVLEYSRLPSEAAEIVRNHRPDAKWPSRGGVTFSNYSTRYREGLPLVLKNITFQVKPKEKVGSNSSPLFREFRTDAVG